MFLSKKYINNKFETINPEKQELNWMTFRQRQSICIRATSPKAVFNLAENWSSPLLVKADIRFVDIYTFNFPVFIWKFFAFGSVGHNGITFPTFFIYLFIYLFNNFIGYVYMDRHTPKGSVRTGHGVPCGALPLTLKSTQPNPGEDIHHTVISCVGN